MSLISEALKKARGDKPGPWAVAHPPPRRAVAPWLTAALALGVAAGVVIGIFVRRDSAVSGETTQGNVVTAGQTVPGAEAPAATESRTPAVERQTAVEPDAPGNAAAGTATPTASDGRVSQAAPPTVRNQDAAAQTLPGTDYESVAAPDPAPPQPAPTPEVQAGPTSPPIQSTATTPPQETEPTDGASYHREVTLPGGVHLALGGIAWSERAPAALVNGRVLGPGEGGDDWTLVAVERGQVEIEWRGVRFFLRLK